MARTKARLDKWYCTDECVRWFGGLMFSPTTGRKFAVTNIINTADRIRKSFNSLAEYSYTFARNPDLDLLVGFNESYPDMKTPNKTADFKGKTVAGSRTTFRRKCNDVRKKGDTPLGFVVGVKPTREVARKERAESGYSLAIHSKGVRDWIREEGGTGHALAVDCEGRVVADTSPSYEKRKKIRTVRQINLVGWFRNWYLHYTPKNPKRNVNRADSIAVWASHGIPMGRNW